MLASASMATSRTANQDAGNENQDSVQSDLQPARRPASPYTRCRTQDDDTQFDCDDQHGGSHRQSKRCEQPKSRESEDIRKCVEIARLGVRPFALCGAVTKQLLNVHTPLGYPSTQTDHPPPR